MRGWLTIPIFSRGEWQIQFTIGQVDNAKVMSLDEFHLVEGAEVAVQASVMECHI